MDSFHNYPKVWNLGHPAVKQIFEGTVLVQEKIDGSQLSFGKDLDGRVRIRSKGREFPIEGPDNLFTDAANTVLSIADKLRPGWTYRGEYLRKPKHNVLCYNRTPDNFIVLFDITQAQHDYAGPLFVQNEATRLGMEPLPCEFRVISSVAEVQNLMAAPSVLGGAREGLVFKNYNRYTIDGHVMMAKHVSETFKEVHHGEWKKDNQNQGDVILMLKDKYCTPARWMKAEQHLRDNGQLLREPKDIGALIKEARKDFEQEVEEQAKEDLWNWAKSKLLDESTRGLPQWYKDRLLKGQFE